MRLAHAYDQAAVREDAPVGIAERVRFRRLGGDRPRRCADPFEAIQPAVVEARAEDDLPFPPEPGAAAVLVDPRPDVEIRWNGIDRLTVVRSKDECCPPLLMRPALRPVGPVRAEVDIAETNAALARDQVWSNRGLPGPERRNGRHDGRTYRRSNRTRRRCHANGSDEQHSADDVPVLRAPFGRGCRRDGRTLRRNGPGRAVRPLRTGGLRAFPPHPARREARRGRSARGFPHSLAQRRPLHAGTGKGEHLVVDARPSPRGRSRPQGRPQARRAAERERGAVFTGLRRGRCLAPFRARARAASVEAAPRSATRSARARLLRRLQPDGARRETRPTRRYDQSRMFTGLARLRELLAEPGNGETAWQPTPYTT